MRQLNLQTLPKHFFAIVEAHVGSQIEADVASFERDHEEVAEDDGGGGTAVAVWAPPVARRAVLDFSEPDLFEVQVYSEVDERRLVAVIELVSPSNKDRPGNRHAFAVKCGSYLQSGVSVVVVDVVTERSADLDEEILDLLGVAPGPSGSELYSAAYRKIFADKVSNLDHWRSPIEVGASLPRMPLWITPRLCVPLDLEPAYEDALRSLRL